MTSTPESKSQGHTQESSLQGAIGNTDSISGSNLAAIGQSSIHAVAKTSSSTPDASEPTNMASAVGGAPPAHNANDSVNGKSTTIPAIPSVNGNNSVNNDHNRKPSMTVTPAGTTTFSANGGAIGGSQSTASKIQFGSVNAAGGSPAMGTPPPLAHSNPNNLGVNQLNPRLTSPQNSPSPIPQPVGASGGRPPSSFQGQGSNGLSFGQLGGDDQSSLVRPMSNLQFSAQPDHMRRTSSQSMHSDAGAQGLPTGPGGRGYTPQGGRGQPYRNQYQQPMTFSPGQTFRPAPNGGRNMQGSYHGRNQQGPFHQGSPAMGSRSPAMMNATPGTPNMGQMHMMPAMQGNPNGYYMGPTQGIPFPTQADPSIQMLYQQQYATQHPMQHGQFMGYAPPSPRPPFQQNPYAAPMQPTYSNQGQPASMSRQSSQMSSAPDRPNSSIGQHSHTPVVPPASGPTPSNARTPSVSTPSKPNFVLPKKSAAITIKNAAGEEVSFSKPASTPAPAPAAPATTAAVTTPSSSTPPAQLAPSADSTRARTESVSAKTEDERKKAMQEAVKQKIEEEARLKKEQAVAEQKSQMDKEAAEAAKQESEEAESRAEALEKEAAEAKAAEAKAAEVKATETKAAEAKAAEDKAAETKAAEDKAAKDKAAEAQAAEDKAAADKDAKEEKAKETESKPTADDEIDYDAIEAELAAQEAEEERREAEYAKKKAADKEAKARKEQEEAEAYETNMKALERKAEEEEELREREKLEKAEKTEGSGDEAAKKMFAELKGSALGTPSGESPAINTPAESGTATPVSDASMPPPSKGSSSRRNKAAELTLDTKKPVEPPEPSATLKSLQSAKKIDDLSKVTYPSEISAPNATLNASAPTERKFKYDKEFLLQFQSVFKEKPSLDWDTKIRDALGDGDSSARAGGSARTPSGMGGRSVSNRPAPAGANAFNMGAFGAAARPPLPPGTTSEQRFAASNGSMRGAPMAANPFAQFGRGPMGPPTGRTPSNNPMGPITGSPRVGGASRGGSRAESRRDKKSVKQQQDENKSMPLTAGMNVGTLEVSSSGWKARSIGQPAAMPALGGEGHLAPDVVQRKVKAALNKMTPEKFERLTDQILEIAAQSKDESDGRTLRQVIQLTFEKATDEAHWAPMYAMFCRKMLESMSPDIKDENIKDKNGNIVTGGNLFRKYLLNRCQEEFERGWKVNLPPKGEGQTEEAVMLSEEYYIAAAAKRRGLGLVKFIGELFKLQMLTERIMHECVKKLVDYEGTPDEAEVESLTSLLRTIGKQLDNPESKAQARMDVYFERINQTMALPDLPSRLRFMLLDILDLRKKGWQSKEDEKGPKTIQEIHAEAEEAARQAELQRLAQQSGGRGGGGGGRMPLGRGDARGFGQYGQVPPPDNSNRVGTDDLRRLGNRVSRNPSTASGPSLGPPSLLGGRTNSGRRGLGPGSLLGRGEDSGTSSRTGTPPVPKDSQKKDEASTNAFSALAALENDVPASPPSNPASPPTQKSQSAIERARSRSPENKATE